MKLINVTMLVCLAISSNAGFAAEAGISASAAALTESNVANSSKATRVFVVGENEFQQPWGAICCPMMLKPHTFEEKKQIMQTIVIQLSQLLNAPTSLDTLAHIKMCLSQIAIFKVDTNRDGTVTEHWRDEERGIVHYLNRCEDGSVYLYTRFGDEYYPKWGGYSGLDCLTDIKLKGSKDTADAK